MPPYRHPDAPGVEDLLDSVIETLDRLIASLETASERIAAAIEQRDDAAHYAALERAERRT